MRTLVLLRLAMAWMFLWSFFDKFFGLGFATAADKAWLAGGSPTFGFLKFGAQGPFGSIFQSMAGSAFVDWIFMLGLLLVGLALLFGVMMKIAGYSGALMMFLIWLAVLFPEHNPFMDEHIVYMLLFIALAYSKAGHVWGLGKWWSGLGFVKKCKCLE